MLLQTLIKYISLNFKYRLRRKTEFFAKILSRWLPLNTINKNIFPIILSVSFFKYILFFSISFFFVKFGMQFLNNFEIISGFFYAIILISLFISAGFVPNVLLPADENILNTSPLSNKEIFIFHWMAHLFNYHISFFIYILIFSLVLFLSLSVTKTFWFSLIIFLLFILLLIFSISIFLCIVTVNRIREGFRWSTLLISLVNGFIAFIISYIICHSIFSWVTSNPNFLAGSSWSQLIEEFFITYKQILDYSVHSYFIVFYLAKLSIENDFMNYIFPLLFFITLIHILFIFSYLNAGKWHRTAWETRSKIKKDWIDVIQQVFLLFSKNIYFRTQVLNLFRNRIQISHHYTFFFFHYSNYIFLGIAAGAMGTVTNDFPILRLCLLFFLYNAISRDAFEAGTTLFPGILRYDGEGKTIQIYRITNDNPLNLYKAKIQLQRLLGMAEFIIIFIG
ncbi:MAG TPA: hypothetical protein DDY49_07320, partial [Paenibacillaceae bacterium]|nr:hypothetical protein [Paenibacillaceae bacterium]